MEKKVGAIVIINVENEDFYNAMAEEDKGNTDLSNEIITKICTTQSALILSSADCVSELMEAFVQEDYPVYYTEDITNEE